MSRTHNRKCGNCNSNALHFLLSSPCKSSLLRSLASSCRQSRQTRTQGNHRARLRNRRDRTNRKVNPVRIVHSHCKSTDARRVKPRRKRAERNKNRTCTRRNGDRRTREDIRQGAVVSEQQDRSTRLVIRDHVQRESCLRAQIRRRRKRSERSRGQASRPARRARRWLANQPTTPYRPNPNPLQ